jgi:hypothetical protein
MVIPLGLSNVSTPETFPTYAFHRGVCCIEVKIIVVMVLRVSLLFAGVWFAEVTDVAPDIDAPVGSATTKDAY